MKKFPGNSEISPENKMASDLDKFAINKKKGEIIFFECESGSEVYFIQQGFVRVSKMVMGREKTLAIIGPGDIFGEMSLLESAPRSATTVAEDDVTLLKFDKNSFAQLVTSRPSIAVKLLRLLAERINDQKQKFNIIRLPDSESKIMAVFLMLAQNMELNIEETVQVNFETNAEKIAGWAGIKTSDCEKALKNMEHVGKLKKTDTMIRVANLYQFSRNVKSKRQSMDLDK